MNETNRVLNRSIAGPYYRQHAGFFLFAFFVLFGTQPSLLQALQFHHAIIRSILESTEFLMIAVLAWSLYALKTVHFFYSCLSADAYSFLYGLNALSRRRRLATLLQLQFLLFLPVWAYSLFVFFIALNEGLAASGVLVGVILVCLSLFSTTGFYFILRTGRSGVILRMRFLRFPVGLFSFLLRSVVREQFVTLGIVKFLSFFALYYLARLPGGLYEDRIVWMIYLIALIGHCVIIYKLHHFKERELGFYRNLPFKPVYTILSLLAVYVVLLLPEMWSLKGVLLLQHQPLDYVVMVASGPAILLMLHCLLYTDDMDMSNYLQLAFGVWLVLVFFSLSANRWMIPVICSCMAVIIFLTSYYKYERKSGVEGLV